MTFPSPTGKAAVEIWQTPLANEWGIRAELVADQRRVRLYERRGETIIYFVHVYWSPDDTKVAVLATGFTILHLAFDAKTGTKIPFEQIREELARSIRKTYHVPEGKDPISWASQSDASFAFSKLHPEVRFSYQ